MQKKKKNLKKKNLKKIKFRTLRFKKNDLITNVFKKKIKSRLIKKYRRKFVQATFSDIEKKFILTNNYAQKYFFKDSFYALYNNRYLKRRRIRRTKIRKVTYLPVGFFSKPKLALTNKNLKIIPKYLTFGISQKVTYLKTLNKLKLTTNSSTFTKKRFIEQKTPELQEIFNQNIEKNFITRFNLKFNSILMKKFFYRFYNLKKFSTKLAFKYLNFKKINFKLQNLIFFNTFFFTKLLKLKQKLIFKFLKKKFFFYFKKKKKNYKN